MQMASQMLQHPVDPGWVPVANPEDEVEASGGEGVLSPEDKDEEDGDPPPAAIKPGLIHLLQPSSLIQSPRVKTR